MKKLTKEWLRAAKDDLDVVERIIRDEHLSHIVAFHAQQCIEKVFKAICEERGIETRKLHSLVNLSSKIEQFVDLEINLTLLQTLDALYIEARYPGELGLLPNGRPTLEDAGRYYAHAEEILTRVSSQLG